MGNNLKVSEVDLCIEAQVLSDPACITRYGKRHILEVLIGIKRQSGVIDELYLNYTDELKVILKKGDFISVTGDIRTINKQGTIKVLKGIVFASSITKLDTEPENYKNNVVIKSAYIESIDEVRKSFDDTNKDIAVYNVKVIRPHSRYSYFRSTSWGRDAVFIGNVMKPNMEVELKARLQTHKTATGKLFVCLAVYYIELLTKKEVTKEHHD